jgi:hypothetical protein
MKRKESCVIDTNLDCTRRSQGAAREYNKKPSAYSRDLHSAKRRDLELRQGALEMFEKTARLSLAVHVRA